MTEFIITIADNGYVLESDDFLSVYESEGNIPNNMCAEILGDLMDMIDNSGVCRFKVVIDVEPLEGYKFQKEGESNND